MLKVGDSGYLFDFEVLVCGVFDVCDLQCSKCIYFLCQLLCDLLVDCSLLVVQIWVLCSYDSLFELLVLGCDVFDVYLCLEGVVIDGLCYQDW